VPLPVDPEFEGDHFTQTGITRGKDAKVIVKPNGPMKRPTLNGTDPQGTKGRSMGTKFTKLGKTVINPPFIKWIWKIENRELR